MFELIMMNEDKAMVPDASVPDVVATKDEVTKHTFQNDLDTAQSAANIGSTLSGISSFVHFLLALGGLSLIGTGHGVSVLYVVIIELGIALSWALFHALLSVVVTNALTAKHVIFQSGKVKS
jgi:hypothetical protein